MLVYPAGLDVSSHDLGMLTRVLRAHRVRIGTPWRALSAREQALLVLAYLRKNETYHALAAGFGIGVATVHRYIHEALDLLAVRAPTLAQAVAKAGRKAYTVLDGTIIRTDRVRMTKRGADKEFYSGKVHHHGMNVQVIAGPFGELLYASPAIPGARHDIACARAHHLPQALATLTSAGRLVLADRGYTGIGSGISTPIMATGRDRTTGAFTRRVLSANEKAVNAAHGRLRAPGERANAQLKAWRALRQLRLSPEKTTEVVHAVTALITAGH